jgi:hypothetical protein
VGYYGLIRCQSALIAVCISLLGEHTLEECVVAQVHEYEQPLPARIVNIAREQIMIDEDIRILGILDK